MRRPQVRLSIEQRLYIRRDLRIPGTSAGLTFPVRDRRRACRRERNRQWKSESQLRISHIASPVSGERECRRVRNRVTSEEIAPIAGAAHGISLVTGARTSHWTPRKSHRSHGFPCQGGPEWLEDSRRVPSPDKICR